MRAPCWLAACLVLVLGCKGEPVGVAGDTGADVTSDVETGNDVGDAVGELETDTAGDTAPRPAGQPCSADKDCDPSWLAGSKCKLTAPTPFCSGGPCSPITADPKLETCAVDGVCLDDGAGGGLCVPLCLFDGITDVLVQPCLGKNLCFYVGSVVRDSKGYGYGRCETGCAADTDCYSGTKCQIQTGHCVTKLVTFPGAIGDACTAAEDGVKCGCVYSLTTKTGYCTQVCRVGESACPTGYTCDADVPATFSVIPSVGMMGYCLKDCTVDDDCKAQNAHCEQHAGLSTKTCQPGP